ncbi:MAG TPA: vWA domain-containing protein [Polyangia bacterium]|jgi:hypothetical protein|nr:vWA domain-containing protein [Polyangia bacterium]
MTKHLVHLWVVVTVALASGGLARAQDAATEGCGDILIVLDRSGSMRTCSINGMTKEALAKNALRTIIQGFSSVPMGLFVFPNDSGAGANASCATGRKVIDVSAGGAPQIINYLDTQLRSNGGTPTGSTMEAVLAYQGWTANHAHYAILITDGQPTCDDGDNMLNDTNGCMGGGVGIPCNGMGRCECQNPTRMFNAIDQMAQKGIHTFVIGFEGMSTCVGRPFNPDTLNKAAELGREPNKTGATKYYSATDGMTLQTALSGIIAYISKGGDPEFGMASGCKTGTFGSGGTGTGGTAGTVGGTGGRNGSGGRGGSSGGGADAGAGLGGTKGGCGCAVPVGGGATLLGLGTFAVGLWLSARRRQPAAVSRK